MRCTNCKKADTQPWEGETTLHGAKLFARGERCPKCEDVTLSLEESQRLEHEAAKAIVGRGIRTGSEFKFVRKMTGRTAVELASILDVEPDTVSRWERNAVKFPRAAAFTLGMLYEKPKATRLRLERFD
jgi:DNA-binding transcriptional regulator YiaG